MGTAQSERLVFPHSVLSLSVSVCVHTPITLRFY